MRLFFCLLLLACALPIAWGQESSRIEQLKNGLLELERTKGADHVDVGAQLINLGSALQNQGRFAEAEPLFRRSLGIVEKSFGPAHPSVAVVLSNLGNLYMSQARYGEAEQLFKRSLYIREKAQGPDHRNVARSWSDLARCYDTQGRFEEATASIGRSIAVLEKTSGSDTRDMAAVLNTLGGIQQHQGRYADAELNYKRSLAIWTSLNALEQAGAVNALNNLGALYHGQGRYAEAEPLMKHVLASREKTYGLDDIRVGSALNNLAQNYAKGRRYGEAEPLMLRSLAISEKVLGPDHPQVAQSLANLGLFYQSQDRMAEVEPLYQRSLAIREKALGPDHPDVAITLNNLGALHLDRRRFDEAGRALERALVIREKAYGPHHVHVAETLGQLVPQRLFQQQPQDALAFQRRSNDIYARRILAGEDNVAYETLSNRSGFGVHLSLLDPKRGLVTQEGGVEESFRIAQLANASATASALSQMAARFASGDGGISDLVRQKQDLGDQLRKAEQALLRAISQPGIDQNAGMRQTLRVGIARLIDAISGVDAELQARFPQYQELTRGEPMLVREAQALMGPDEAMMVYAMVPGRSQAWLWVITQTQARFVPLALVQEELAAKIAFARGQLQPDPARRLQRPDVRRLHDMFKSVFEPAMPYLAGVNHIIVVPAGPLQSLPFGMLVASPPADVQSVAGLREVDWLIKRYAFSALPSVSSLRMLRMFGKASTAPEPFAGFGDPVLTDAQAPGSALQADLSVAYLFGRAQAGIANVAAIKRQRSLPETADELRAMASTLKARPDTVRLRDQATETVVKSMDLSRYRVIAFSTHGVMAGELSGIREPGLILTPPAAGTAQDDGYLSSGEIAKLKLNADWILLSACNTAASDGTLGAEGMSGLAKAFFYAGSRALLVSHWAVASAATVPLTTVALEHYASDTGVGKAQALRKSMLNLMNTAAHPEYAHPFFWAPFVVVGEGGRR